MSQHRQHFGDCLQDPVLHEPAVAQAATTATDPHLITPNNVVIHQKQAFN